MKQACTILKYFLGLFKMITVDMLFLGDYSHFSS